MSTKVSQETNVLIIIKQVFTTYFSELSKNPEKRKPATQLYSFSSVTLHLPLKHPYGNSQMPDCPCHTAG